MFKTSTTLTALETVLAAGAELLEVERTRTDLRALYAIRGNAKAQAQVATEIAGEDYQGADLFGDVLAA